MIYQFFFLSVISHSVAESERDTSSSQGTIYLTKMNGTFSDPRTKI